MFTGTYFWYQLLCVSSAALSVGLMWRILHRRAPGSRPAAAFMAAAALWSLGAAGEYGCTTAEQARVWFAVAAIGKAFGSLTWFVMVLEYLRYHTVLTRRNLLALSIVPAMAVLLRWTDPWLGWFYRHPPLPGAFAATNLYTPLGWVTLGYSLMLAFSGLAFLLLHAGLATASHRGQILTLFACALLPAVASTSYLLDLGPLAAYDLTPITLNLTGAMVAIGMVRHRLFRVTPMLHETVVAALKDGIIIIDASGEIVECNAAARLILGTIDAGMVGLRWPDCAPEWHRAATPPAGLERWDVTHEGVTLQVSRTSCPAPHTDETIITLRDVTAERALAEEKARRAIARYLHDDIGQSVSACLLHLAAMQRQEASPALRERLQAAAAILEHTLSRSRAVTMEVTPALHCGEGLTAMLNWLAANMQRAFGIAIHVETDGSEPDVGVDGCRRLFRMTRELLFNAVKHARAQEIRVAVSAGGGRVRISVTDDGVGIPAGSAEPQGMGLATVREELAALGGELVIAPSPTGGTSAGLLLPLDHIRTE